MGFLNKLFEGFWLKLADLIIANRKKLLAVIGIITLFMTFQITRLEMSYELAKILPVSDENFQIYEKFKKQYGEDGNVMVIAIESKEIYTQKVFNHWYDLSKKIKSLDGIKQVLSNATLYKIVKDERKKKFIIQPLLSHKPKSQSEVDSLKNEIGKLPFYDGFVYNRDAQLMAVTFDQAKLNSKDRISLSLEIEKLSQEFGKRNGIEMHFSGMPFIRTNFMSKVSRELTMFMVLAFLVTSIILFLFFRSFKVMLYSAAVVLVAVVWSVGIIALLGYKISILTGLIPPLIIVIGIPNSIFIINKYQEEFLRTKNKIQSLKTSIEKIGKTTFIANLTTFIGFFVFYFTGSPLLLEFGLVAAICVMATWAISLILIPTIFSYTGEPEAKHVRHLENKNITAFLQKTEFYVLNKRNLVYMFVGGLVVISIIGALKIKAVGYVVDDLPEKDPIFRDLKFIEKNFKGIVPFEVSIDTKTAGGVLQPELLNEIKSLQKEFAKYPEFTKPLSVVEGVKFAYQGFRGGDAKFYVLPPALELQKMAEFTQNEKGKKNMLSAFVDSTNRYTRISFQCADVGSVKLKSLYENLQAKADSIFNFDKEVDSWKPKAQQVVVQLTGNGVVFTKGNDYLLSNLAESTLLAILLVSMVMATQFMNLKTILVSSIPSIIPLIITAGLMGYFNIPLKPSTTLIFSIAFGIASDGTIYFLTKYKEELLKGRTVEQAVSETIKYTGISMFYTAVILFFGFFIFVASGFKGTIYLGLLVSITLLIGMISNLILLPCFLISLDSRRKKNERVG